MILLWFTSLSTEMCRFTIYYQVYIYTSLYKTPSNGQRWKKRTLSTLKNRIQDDEYTENYAFRHHQRFG
jgi:hypothetical protein